MLAFVTTLPHSLSFSLSFTIPNAEVLPRWLWFFKGSVAHESIKFRWWVYVITECFAYFDLLLHLPPRVSPRNKTTAFRRKFLKIYSLCYNIELHLLYIFISQMQLFYCYIHLKEPICFPLFSKENMHNFSSFSFSLRCWYIGTRQMLGNIDLLMVAWYLFSISRSVSFMVKRARVRTWKCYLVPPVFFNKPKSPWSITFFNSKIRISRWIF